MAAIFNLPLNLKSESVYISSAVLLDPENVSSMCNCEAILLRSWDNALCTSGHDGHLFNHLPWCWRVFTAVLLDPGNVGSAFEISLQSCKEAERLRFFTSTSGEGRPYAISDSRRHRTVSITSVSLFLSTKKMRVWLLDSRCFLVYKLSFKFFKHSSGMWPPSLYPVRTHSSNVRRRKPIWLP